MSKCSSNNGVTYFGGDPFAEDDSYDYRNKNEGNFAPCEFHDGGIQLQPNAAGPHKS